MAQNAHCQRHRWICWRCSCCSPIGNLTGYRTETGAALFHSCRLCRGRLPVAILLERTRRKPLRITQRMRWVVWGCYRSGFRPSSSPSSRRPPRSSKRGGRTATIGRCHRAALPRERHPLPVRVRGGRGGARGERVDPTPPRVTILGTHALSIPALLLHHEVSTCGTISPSRTGRGSSSAPARFISSAACMKCATHLTDPLFQPRSRQGRTNHRRSNPQGERPLEVDRLLSEQPYRRLKLSSAAAFRRNGTEFRRDTEGHGWGEKTAAEPVARCTDARTGGEGRSLRHQRRGRQ